MQILSVTLRNFKCHADKYFEFQPGTNAICGENGAGKTSILEAIAWTLFNHSDYSKDDLIRRGAKSAQVIILFISSKDGRTYQVDRSTGSRGYTIFDPQLQQNLGLSRLDDQVLPWLREHLGVPRDCNLADLFSTLVGIPQGTFTADFLKRGSDRKKVFDPLLNVEEYKQVYVKSSALERYSQQEIDTLTQKISQYDDRLQDWDGLKQQYQTLIADITASETQLTQINRDLSQIQLERDRLLEQAKTLQTLEAQLQTIATELTSESRALELHQQACDRAMQATQTCQANLAAYEQYQVADAALQQLQQKSKERKRLQDQREGAQDKVQQQGNKITEIAIRLAQIARYRAEMEQLTSAILRQEELEKRQAEINIKLQEISTAHARHQALSGQISRQQSARAALTKAIDRLQGLADTIAEIPHLEAQQQRYQTQISRVAAAQQFEAELRQFSQRVQSGRDRQTHDTEAVLTALAEVQNAVPLFADKLEQARAVLSSGLTLTQEFATTLEQILADLADQVSPLALQTQLEEVQQTLRARYQAQAEFATIAAKQQEKNNLQAELTQQEAELAQIGQQLAQESDLRAEHDRIRQALAELENPRGKHQLLQSQVQQAPTLESEQAALQQTQAQLQQRLDQITTQLAAFADLDEQIQIQSCLRQASQAGYQQYLQAQSEAKRLKSLQQDLDSSQQKIAQLQQRQTTIRADRDRQASIYDPERANQIQRQFEQLAAKKNQLTGSLPPMQQQRTYLENQLTERATLAIQRQQAQADLARKQATHQFIRDLRQAYNQAGPRITRFYLEEISREADQLFRDLINRQNLALKWTNDYEIQVQEGGYWRTFRSLSGGEQMCAALAVRLALLKVLADLDIAFFDEPTTNMDTARRRQLAEALTRLRSFRQLFVISHDDTFESVTENIVRVDRQ